MPPPLDAAAGAGLIEDMRWGAFINLLWRDPDARWKQGEHMALVGPTGQGKTTLLLQLLQVRRYVVLVATKPRDKVLAKLRKKGWQEIADWPPHADRNRVLLWLRIKNLETSAARIRPKLARALQAMYDAGAWTIVLDDLQGLLSTLRLGRYVELLLLNARSMDLTVVTSTQRPRWVPQEVWTQSTHIIIWRCSDEYDLKRIGGLGVADSKPIRETVARLGDHEFLYVNTRTGRLIRSKLDLVAERG